jgi:hypothetical protein
LSTWIWASDCPLPAWPTLDDPATVAALDRDSKLETSTEQQYREEMASYVRCHRLSLRKRTATFPPSEVATMVRQAHDHEIAMLSRADALKDCMTAYLKAASATDAKSQCDGAIQAGLSKRALGDRATATKVIHAEFPAFRGLWTYDLEELSVRPCADDSCDRAFGLSITNLTPVDLLCRATLAPPAGAKQVEQSTIVPPGYTVAAVKLTAELSRQASVSGTAVCEEKRWPEEALSGNCTLRWSRAPSGYPEAFRRNWLSGAALVEFTAQDRTSPTDLFVKDDNSVEAIGRAALNALRPLRVHTNCPGVRFRVRLEFSTIPCLSCPAEGAITLIRN